MSNKKSTPKVLSRLNWRLPDIDNIPLHFSIADSVLREFVLSHDPSAFLTELVQNEYDARGTRLELLFSDRSLSISGNGEPVDRSGWTRLSVMLGTGSVAGSDRIIKAKTNSIGSKNFGLRSLFIFGNQIFIRSGGHQTVLDLQKGAPSKPLPERRSKNRLGIQIDVPYRTVKKSDLEAFDIEKESITLDKLAKDMLPTLIKLANPERQKSLNEMVVSSKRCTRRLVWQQSVVNVPAVNRRVKVSRRRIIMRDTRKSEESIKTIKKLEELEFEKSLKIPEAYKEHNIPEYFKVPGGRVRIALSLRVNQDKIDLSGPGLFYYPLGLIHSPTGTGISINAPFQLDNDRTRIINPDNNPWNEWLIEEAADFTIELLTSEWFERFGSTAYLALNETFRPDMAHYLELLKSKLKTSTCWPTRIKKRGNIEFTSARNIIVPLDHKFDDILSAGRYLDEKLASDPGVNRMVLSCGAKSFTTNSLVRLRCFGKDNSSMKTTLNEHESDIYYEAFPSPLMDESRQIQFAEILDFEAKARRISNENRIDLINSQTTLSASSELQAPSLPLWVVDSTLEGVCPVPNQSRLHPSLSNSKIIAGLCRKFDSSDWVRKTAEKISRNLASEEERRALYDYIVSIHGHVGRKTQASLRKLPILIDHRGDWVSPMQITAKSNSSTKRFEAVLHFPNTDYARDEDIARAFRFKEKIERDDILNYAQLIESRPELAEDFELNLQRIANMLTRPMIKKLRNVKFLLDSRGNISAPEELYLKNQLNFICLGSKAPFVNGNHLSLYKLLGCRELPISEDIVEYLLTLDEKPRQSDFIYTILASSLKAEKLPLNSYSKGPIIWNGTDFSKPEDTLLGLRYRKTFLDAIPCISTSSLQMKEVMSSLGACVQPSERHWKLLLTWFGEKYRISSGIIPENQRKILRRVYRELMDFPEGASENLNYLLGRDGRLHNKSEGESGGFLIDDNPKLSNAIVEQGIPIAFADTFEPGTLRFFYNVGIKSLTDFHQTESIEFGEDIVPPAWFDQTIMLNHIHSPEFLSALSVLQEHELKGLQSRQSTDSTLLQARLKEIEKMSFTKEIKGVHRIGGYQVFSFENVALLDNSIKFVRVRSDSELFSLLSHVIATILTERVTLQRTFSDSVYRLLTCRSVREMKQYLYDKGIPWKISYKIPDEENEEENETTHGQGTNDIGNIIADLFKKSLAAGKGGNKGLKPPAPKKPEDKPPPSKRKAPKLPALNKINVNILKPSESWIPPEPRGSGGGGGGSSHWTPPNPLDEEWARKIGRRGEEIIYKNELKRVTDLGYPKSRVVWIADDDPGAEYDILSVDDNGEDIFIEVKSTTSKDGRFQWPKAEFEKAIQERDSYILWRVYETDTKKPSIKPFKDPVGILLKSGMRLDIDTFYAIVEPMQT